MTVKVSLEERKQLTKREEFRIPRILLFFIFFLDRALYHDYLKQENLINRIRQKDKAEIYKKPPPPPPRPPQKKVPYYCSAIREKGTASTGPRFLTENTYTQTATTVPLSGREIKYLQEEYNRKVRQERFKRAKEIMENDINFPPIRPMGELRYEGIFKDIIIKDEPICDYMMPEPILDKKNKGSKKKNKHYYTGSGGAG